jgi:hypothetical protein
MWLASDMRHIAFGKWLGCGMRLHRTGNRSIQPVVLAHAKISLNGLRM